MTIDEKPTEAVTLSIELLESNPKVRRGRPIIKGTGITVHNIVAAHLYRGESVNEIVENLPHLTLAQVYAALAYYYSHKQEIDADVEADHRAYEEAQEQAIADGNPPLLG